MHHILVRPFGVVFVFDYCSPVLSEPF
jgi:hypothetical protein